MKTQSLRTKSVRVRVVEFQHQWAKYYISIPPNLEIYDLKRPWIFKTKEEAERFAVWLDETLLILECSIGAEILAPYGKTPKDAFKMYVKHLEALKAEREAASEK